MASPRSYRGKNRTETWIQADRVDSPNLGLDSRLQRQRNPVSGAVDRAVTWQKDPTGSGSSG